jgi:hypothetical protein
MACADVPVTWNRTVRRSATAVGPYDDAAAPRRSAAE